MKKEIQNERVQEELERQEKENADRLGRDSAAERKRVSQTQNPQPKPTGEVKRPTEGGDIWTALGNCESGNNPKAISGNGKYHGAFQFSLSTWRSVGGTGSPTDFSYDYQLKLAKKLQAKSGWGQWPRCSRRLGLR